MSAGKGTLKHLLCHTTKWDVGYEILKAEPNVKGFWLCLDRTGKPVDELLKLNKFKAIEKRIKKSKRWKELKS